MDITAPRPELWTRIAAFLGALRTFLRGAVPDKFDKAAANARAHLMAAAALVRRYIHVLAADIALPPLADGAPAKSSNQTPNKLQRRRESLFRLTELADTIKRASKGGGSDNRLHPMGLDDGGRPPTRHRPQSSRKTRPAAR
jgi:hypothetical protein